MPRSARESCRSGGGAGRWTPPTYRMPRGMCEPRIRALPPCHAVPSDVSLSNRPAVGAERFRADIEVDAAVGVESWRIAGEIGGDAGEIAHDDAEIRHRRAIMH